MAEDPLLHKIKSPPSFPFFCLPLVLFPRASSRSVTFAISSTEECPQEDSVLK